MNVEQKSKIRVELHVHTQYSKDSRVDLRRLLAHCEKLGIDRIAITDHNEIDGAFEAYKIAPDKVIVGEEIKTTKGELLGYFMKEKIPSGLEPWEVIRRLRMQDALISVAHPFDTVRSQHWDLSDLTGIASLVDAIETHNSRCLTDEPNQKADAFAENHSLLKTVGSDAHSLFEVGRGTLWMAPFDGPEEFKAALATAEPETRLSPGFVHLFSRFAFYSKRIGNLKNKASQEHPS